MAQSKFALAAAALTAAMIVAPAASFAAPVPTTINLVDDGHNVTVYEVQQQLRASGFTNLGTMVRDGRIFELPAVWEGESVNLKVNARTRTIRQVVSPVAVAGNALPTNMTLVGEPHELSLPQVVAGLRDLGFTNISDVQRSGRIFGATAIWQGASIDLRYDAANGMITDRSVTKTQPAGTFPRGIINASDPHETSVQDMRRSLAALGFTQIGNVEQDGRIFTLAANWQGEALDLRIDAASGRIIRR